MSAQELITEHLDLWTGAVTKKSSSGRGSNGKVELTGVKKLRELILELAIRGKLVDQDPADEPASVLLSRIKVKKEELVKLGKIKRPRSLPPITNEEAPSDLPPSWACARAGDFLHIEMGQSPASKFYNQAEDGLPFFQGKADFGDLYPTARYWCTHPTKYAEVDDILLSVRAPVGPTNISNISACIGRGLCALRPLAGVPPFMVLYMFRAIRSELEARATGTTFAAVSRKDIETLVLRVPPLTEQHRIAQKVDELMVLCDRLEQQTSDQLEAHETLVDTLLGTLTQSENATELADNWARLTEHFDTLFTTEQSTDKLKQTILQLAVMGRLVEQKHGKMDTNSLLHEITLCKKRLIDEGKLKKQKTLPAIADEEKTIPIPASWEWVRLQDVIDVRDGTHDSPKNATGPDTYPLVTSKDFRDGQIDFSNAKRISEEDHRLISQRSLVEPEDILFSMIGGNIGNQVLVNTSEKFSVKNVALFKYYDKTLTVPRFLKIFTEDLANSLQDQASGGAQPFVSLGKLRNLPFPIAPVEEQHRIVQKVDELMALCDHLKERLTQASNTRCQLAGAVVESALN